MATPTPQQMFDLASRLQRAGRAGEAEKLYRQLIDQDPGHAAALNNLANLLYARGDFSQSINVYRSAVSTRPDFVEAWANLSGALRRLGDFDEAIVAARRALALKPNFAEVHLNLGDSLYGKGRYNEAMTAYRQALAWRSNYLEARIGLGLCFYALRRVDDAIAEYRKVFTAKSDHAVAHFNLGLALLLKGDFENGLPEWEWRWKAPELGLPRHKFAQPKWDGLADLSGRRILLHAEQGIGDTIQFARYVPLVAERGAKVVLYCQSNVRRLLSSLSGVEKIVEAGDDVGEFDYHCSLLSMAQAMGTRLDTIPDKTPYLFADMAQTLRWQERFPVPDRRKIGLVWAGRVQNTNNATRSLSLTELAPLVQIPNATFCSLQKGEAAADVQATKNGLKILDWTAELQDFADTAALISSLDLVIAVDTAIAHLAGALGKPVCVLLSYGADWRWFLDRNDSPWYPTARLFRQTRPNDWSDPIREIVHSLQNYVRH